MRPGRFDLSAWFSPVCHSWAMAVGFYAASSDTEAVGKIQGLLARIKEANLLDSGFDPALAHTAAVDWAEKIASYNIILLGGAVFFVLLGLLLVFLLSRLENSKRADAVGRVMSNGYVALAAAIIFLGLCALYAFQSGAAATRISAVPTLLLFAALSLVIVNFLAVQSGGVGRLVVWALATVAVVFSLFDFANNHRVRRVPYLAQTAPAMPDLPDTFRNWLQARTDQSKILWAISCLHRGGTRRWQLCGDARRPFPELHAGAVSEFRPSSLCHQRRVRRQRRGRGLCCRDEGRRATRRRQVPDTGCADRSGEDPAISAVQILDDDFWSPLQAMWLFPDLLQQFLPVRVEIFDRARALEHGLEASWERSVTRNDLYGPRVQSKTANTMAEPFLSLWPQGFEQVAVHASADPEHN